MGAGHDSFILESMMKRLKTLCIQSFSVGAIIPALSAPTVAADKVPEMGGLWGRDSLNLEQPLSGPGPIVNIMRTPDGTMDMNKLVGDYNSPILKPEAAAIL